MCMINSDVRDMINRIVKLKKSYGSIDIKRNIITVYKECGRKLMCTVIGKYKTKIILDHISSFNIISNKYQLRDRECVFPAKGMIMFKTCFSYMLNISYSMKYQSNILFRILEKKNIVSCSDEYYISAKCDGKNQTNTTEPLSLIIVRRPRYNFFIPVK
jgi:hypothetical protein